MKFRLIIIPQYGKHCHAARQYL